MATFITDEELQNIIMKCPNENTEYNDPQNMLTKDGNKKYAYVTLVMLGDLYIAGAIVMAHSVRKCGSKADLVVLVTPDVSEEGKNILRIYFNHVINVKYITVQNWRTKKQRHRKYLELVFTKFHVFNLTQYEKILLIDADALVLKYPDHLFTLDAPAGCFLENKDYIISYDKDGNYVLPPDKQLEWYKKYCECCMHGKKINKEHTDKLYREFKNSGIGGGLMLLKPNKDELSRIIETVGNNPFKYLVENKFVWPEQQFLTLYYSGKWTSINPRFFGLQGFPHWKILYGLQYGGDKPFVVNSKFDIKTRMQYPDYVLWHEYYYEILQQHPKLTISKSLKEANEMNKFFYSSIHKQKRLISRISNDSEDPNNKQIISKLFNVDSNKINNNHLKYYHTRIDNNYNNKNIEPMWTDIKNGDFIEPIKRLDKYFSMSGKKNYYTDIIEKYQDTFKESPKRLDVTFPIQTIQQHDKDCIMLEYIKCKPDIFVLTLWPIILDKMSTSNIEKIIEKFGNIIYSKQLILSKKTLHNLMFWMYDDFTFESRLSFIAKKMDYVNSSESNKVLVIFLQNVKDLKISGQGAPIKKQIRQELIKNGNLSNDTRGNDVLHINDFFYQTISYGQMMLNDNTLKMLHYQNVHNITNSFFNTSMLKMDTFKKWCMTNLSQLEQTRMIIMGGSVLFSYGMRKSNDIDAVFISIGYKNNQAEEELSELLYDNFNKEDFKFFFSDVGIENHPIYWKESWTEKNNKVLNYFDVQNMIELATNPENYYYFNGLKIYTINYEIIRKIYRNRKQDHADFLMMSSLYTELISQFVRMKNGNLIYDIDPNLNISAPELKHKYTKKLLMMIYERYVKSDINKFKQKLQFL